MKDGRRNGKVILATFEESEEQLLQEVLAVFRNNLVIQKSEQLYAKEINFTGLSIWQSQRKVQANGNEIYLSRFEFDVLLFLAKHPRQIFTRKQIYEAVWDDIPVSVDAKVECMIYSIRKKLRKYTDREYIQTVWGVGYKFDPGT